jgi:hypothetical protein
MNANVPNLTIHYSSYGYVEIDENVFQESIMIPITGVRSKITGTINVTLYLSIEKFNK